MNLEAFYLDLGIMYPSRGRDRKEKLKVEKGKVTIKEKDIFNVSLKELPFSFNTVLIGPVNTGLEIKFERKGFSVCIATETHHGQNLVITRTTLPAINTDPAKLEYLNKKGEWSTRLKVELPPDALRIPVSVEKKEKADA